MSIDAQVLDFINHPDPAGLESLALAVFAHQFVKVSVYREFCLSRSAAPDRVHSIDDIPPVSTAAFKYVAFRAGAPQRTFLTSGTTRGLEQRGRHFVPNLQLYRASAIKHLERMLFPDGCRPWMLALHPTADRMPESSLSQMISWCFENFAGAKALCCATPQHVDSRTAVEFLNIAGATAAPVCILGTTAALSAMLEHLRMNNTRLRLASGSRLMDTGGPKGQSEPLAPNQVQAMVEYYLAIPSQYVINEYGMTELCSQLYDATAFNFPQAPEPSERVKIAPPWLKVIVRDPATLRPASLGEVGLLSFFDLANAGSVSALLSEDLGVVNADGTVRVLGRVLGADDRGCALGIEQFAQRQSAEPPPAKSRIPVVAPIPGGARPEAARHRASLTEIGRGLLDSLRVPLQAQRIANALADACAQWRAPQFSQRAATLEATAASTGQSLTLLGESLNALLASFTREAMLDLAQRLSARDRLIGFIMPGNVIGAGLHELVQALIAGAAVLVKASSFEPLFFAEFHRTLRSIDESVAARMEVAVWERSDHDSTRAMARACDRVVAFGDDDTIAAIAAIAGPKLVGFGSRLSGALLSRDSIAGARRNSVAAALARDVTLFDQRGCMSLHHIFVEAPRLSDARDFARLLAHEMELLARSMPAAKTPPIAELSASRAIRENARWRRFGGFPLELWEGEDLSWTVVFHPDAGFQASPLCRTVCVSALRDQSELRERLGTAADALEGCAIDDPAKRLAPSIALLREIGVSYCCAPGYLQSPPPSWPHGGGRFLRMMVRDDG
jgi:hypothetical protein